MTSVLLAEDDPTIAEPLARALIREGYDVVVQGTGQGAIATAPSVDLVILDLGLPDIDGLDVARWIRGRGLTTAGLVLTARADEVDLVVGLDAGADDYVTKPFRLAELLARVRAVSTRTGVVRPRPLIHRATSRPSMSGRPRSRITRSTEGAVAIAP